MEGRAARRRLPDLVVGRAHGYRGRPTRWSPSATACARTSSRRTRRSTRTSVHVIYNGIDADFYRPDPDTDVLERLGVDLEPPYVAFVGRITRQKGVPHLLRAGLHLDPAVQLVLLAGAADTPELKAETDALIEDLRAARDGVFVVSEMLPREDVRQVLTARARVLLPVGLRAARHRQPRGDGLRDRRRGQRRRRHPRGGRRRRRPACSSTTRRRTRTGFEERVRRGGQPARRRPGRGRADGPRRAGRAVEEFGWDAVARRPWSSTAPCSETSRRSLRCRVVGSAHE